VREKAVKLVKREYGDFGPTLAAEYLEEKHGVKMSKETLRKLLIEAGVWKRQRRRVEERVATVGVFPWAILMRHNQMAIARNQSALGTPLPLPFLGHFAVIPPGF